MDPRTAYLRCHELQYQDFKSAQELLEALKDYQRMAPDQLSSNNLISILCCGTRYQLPCRRRWERLKIGLFKSYILQRLLRAEARIEEMKRRNKGNDWSKVRKSGGYKGVSKKECIEKPVDKPPDSSKASCSQQQQQ